MERLIGKRPFERQTTYEEFTNGTLEAKKEQKRAADKKKSEAQQAKLKIEQEQEQKEKEVVESKETTVSPESEKEK